MDFFFVSSYMNKPPDMFERDSHKLLSFFSCQTNADEVVVAVFGADSGSSSLLIKIKRKLRN